MRKKAVAQGLVGFILGAIVSAVLLASEPQLVGDVQSGLHDLRHGAGRLVADRDSDRGASSERRYGDSRDDRDDRDDRDYRDSGRDDRRDRYGSDQPPSSDSRSRDSGDSPSTP